MKDGMDTYDIQRNLIYILHLIEYEEIYERQYKIMSHTNQQLLINYWRHVYMWKLTLSELLKTYYWTCIGDYISNYCIHSRTLPSAWLHACLPACLPRGVHVVCRNGREIKALPNYFNCTQGSSSDHFLTCSAT